MIWNRHSALAGSHALLSASKYAWINYDEDQLDRYYAASQAAERGDRLHALAKSLIDEGVKLPKNSQTLNMHVNDAIGYRMNAEQMLVAIPGIAYGTADAISFRESENLLRVHDLKTGVTPTSFDQHSVYAAFFCIEYDKNPFKIGMEFRTYQNDERKVEIGDPDKIMRIMAQAKVLGARLRGHKMAELGLVQQ